ncbi:MAG: hypothetical protein K0S55_842 [Clostridia bacterium]|nr:hypothetical protein [Clostridia bacterium]
MKKTLAILITLAMVITFTFVFSAEEHTGQTDCVWGTPDIDGVKEAVWDTAKKVDLKISSTENISTYGSTWTLWDGQYLYVFAEVTDPLIDLDYRTVNPTYGEHEGDCVGVLVDYSYNRTAENNYREETEASMYAGYINVAPDNQVAYHIMMSKVDYKDKIATVAKKTAKGYDVEIKLPLSIYKEFKAGDKIGIEYFINNANGNAARENFVNWEAYGNNSWQWSDAMGTLTFLAAPAVAETPEEVTDNPTTSDNNIFIFAFLAVFSAFFIINKKNLIK